MSSFKNDNYFSKHKDEVLSEYWKSLAYQGRYIFTNSEMLQKTLGIDIILQIENNNKEITVDTKHVRGNYKRLFLEGMSCTVEEYGLKEGWGIKKEGIPDYIMHVMHEYCSKDRCTQKGEECLTCSYNIDHITSAYITPAKNILGWYRPRYINGILKKDKADGYHIEPYSNRTDGHNIHIDTMINELGTRLCRLPTSEGKA